MNCKCCGCFIEDENEGKYCPECGKPLYEEETEKSVNDTEDTVVSENEISETEAEEVDLTENESDGIEVSETDEAFDETEEAEETFEESFEPKTTKTRKGGAMIAAFAVLVIVGCVLIVAAVTSLKKKADDGIKEDASSQTATEGTTGNNSSQELSGEFVVDEGTVGDYSEYEQYVTTLGDYIGVEVNMTPEEVTDEAIDERINSILESATTNVQITDRDVVEEGDIANIDYVGYIDGEAFDGGSYEGYNLTIGSGSFIDGFEDGLIGATVGETLDLVVTFPQDYKNEDYAGKEATFVVTVNSISQQVTPELNDEWLANNTECTTIEEYREVIRTELEKTAAQDVVDSKATRVLETIYNNSVISSFPEGEIEDYVSYMTSYYEYYASMFGTTLEDFVTNYYGMSLEDFNAEMNSIAETNIGTEIVCYCIAAAEGMTLTDEEYNEGAAKFAEENNYETVEEFEAAYTKAQIYDRVILDRVMDFVTEQAVEVME